MAHRQAAWPEMLILMPLLRNCLGVEASWGGPDCVTGKTRAPDGDVILILNGDIFRKRP